MTALRQSVFVPSVPHLVAEHLGLLADIAITTERTTGSAQQLAQLLAGDLDLVVTAIDNLFEWTQAGADLQLVAQVESHTPLRVVSRAEISTLDELGQRPFAVDAPWNGFALVARRLLADRGVEARFVEVGGVRERLDALVAGTVDATLLGPPFDAVAMGLGMRLLADVSELLPGLPGQGLVVRRAVLGSPVLTDYLGALERAVAWCAAVSDDEGVALLESSGYAAASADVWSARPRSLEVDRRGLDVVTELRAGLGLLGSGVDLQALVRSAA
jgi:ABC-type nitrate/sulfonate/bicarbonate transport system substrate-binding protein